jgi:DNA-directed RNA polymerase specialized sigma24 family protein
MAIEQTAERTTISAREAAELVARAQQGDQMAFAELYETYRPLVYRFLRRRLDGSDETVEDLTEDVFVKLYEKLDRYVERGLPFTAWLYRIAHNQLVDFVRTLPRCSAPKRPSRSFRRVPSPTCAATSSSPPARPPRRASPASRPDVPFFSRRSR